MAEWAVQTAHSAYTQVIVLAAVKKGLNLDTQTALMKPNPAPRPFPAFANTALALGLVLLALPVFGQQHFLEPADSLHKGRFWTGAAVGTGLYAGASYGLYHAWYKNYELGPFRTFDDSHEWLGMDKAGHAMTAHNQAQLAFHGLLWTGMPRRKSMWMSAGVAMLLQTTVEVMDGFSAKWGFSWYDMGFNTLGAGVFIGQEMAWGEQRILSKVSNTRPAYSAAPITSLDGAGSSSLRRRAHDLYGASYAEAFLKDYNGQIIWASANIRAFAGPQRASWLPPWLNIAAGYGAGNMYGGFSNTWSEEDGARYVLDAEAFPRYRQFYLSFDADLSRIPTRKRWLRTAFRLLNWVKIPAPTLEINTLGELKLHPVYW